MREQPLSVAEMARGGQLDERTARLLAYLLLVDPSRSRCCRPPADVEPAAARQAGAPPTPLAAMRPPAAPGAVAKPATPMAGIDPRHPWRRRAPPIRCRPRVPRLRPRPRGSRRCRPTAARRPPGIAASPPDERVAGAAAAGLSPELAERWKEIAERAATHRSRRLLRHARRGARRDRPGDRDRRTSRSPSAGTPTGCRRSSRPSRDACSRVFSRMSEARATLADDKQRARYMKLLADGSGSPETQETVARSSRRRTNFQKAEVRFKRNDLVPGGGVLPAGLERTPRRPTTWRCSRGSPRSSRRTRRREDAREDPHPRQGDQDERPLREGLFFRGMLYKRLGKNEMAAEDFKRVRAQPAQHRRRARGAPAHDARQAPPSARRDRARRRRRPATRAAGLFGRLFKK